MMHERRGSWFEGLEAPKAVRGIRCQANRRLSILRCWLWFRRGLLRSRSALVRIMSY